MTTKDAEDSADVAENYAANKLDDCTDEDSCMDHSKMIVEQQEPLVRSTNIFQFTFTV